MKASSFPKEFLFHTEHGMLNYFAQYRNDDCDWIITWWSKNGQRNTKAVSDKELMDNLESGFWIMNEGKGKFIELGD